MTLCDMIVSPYPDLAPCQALYTLNAEEATDLRKHCARGGTRTAFQVLETLGSRENMRNPKQSDGCSGQYAAENVDTVHTPVQWS